MIMWKFLKKLIIFLFIISILLVIRYDERIYPRYEIVMENDIFARYSEGNVYIGNDKFIKDLKNISEKDILVVDARSDSDPTLRVLSSYKITDNNLQNEIIHILLEYERRNPSAWNRTMKKMKIEWTAHNLLYYFDYQVNRTSAVDFNNKDESVYNRKMLKDLIKKVAKKVINRLGNL